MNWWSFYRPITFYVTLMRFLNVTYFKWTSSYFFQALSRTPNTDWGKTDWSPSRTSTGNRTTTPHPNVKKLIYKIREIYSVSIFTKCWTLFLGIPSTFGGFAVQHEEQDGGWNRPQRTPTIKHSMQIWGWTTGHGTKLPGKMRWKKLWIFYES